MTNPASDIERVVYEVLREHGLVPEAGSGTAPHCSQESQHEQTGSTHVTDAQLVLSARVVTMSELGDRLEGVRRLVVPPEAVVTPSVRDELRRRNVTLTFESPPPDRPGATFCLAVVTAGKSYDPAALIAALRNESIEVQLNTSDCLIAATDLLAREVVRPDTLGLLLTADPAAALCLANRLAGVRAILGNDLSRLAADAAAVGANLLVLDLGGNLFHLKQLVVEFCRDGVRQCPEVFHHRLA